MGDSSISITPGSGAMVDTRSESTNGNHRQVIVIGDPSDNDGIASVNSTNGLAVDVKQSVLPSGAATNSELSNKLNDSTFTNRIGEVQTTPTTNTVLGRLKNLEDKNEFIVKPKIYDGSSQWVDQRQIWSDSDGFSGVNLLATGSFNHIYNGNSWKRLTGDSSHGVNVQEAEVDWAKTGQDTTNNYVVIDKTAETGKTHYVKSVQFSLGYYSTPIVHEIKIDDGTNVLWRIHLTSGKTYTHTFPGKGLNIGEGKTMNIVIMNDGNSDIIGNINVQGYTV